MGHPIDPKRYTVPPDVEFSDIDLDAEDFQVGGRRLTEALAEEIADDVHRRVAARAGRPSLTGAAQISPQITARVSPDLRARLTARAEREHKPTAEVIREALERYV